MKRTIINLEVAPEVRDIAKQKAIDLGYGCNGGVSSMLRDFILGNPAPAQAKTPSAS
ncbi:hypothetical protein [Leptolyngbya sp. GGD]|uniref:hypothetical protein n=1 Tax=Leptolyngbya sp. GGD TaxID=2997907 RepID=UPI00227BD20C|nr:hypothetical protein [Leptolyngbya sp. GGD]MCY6493140.1 hypothetical protein [Leptolyngbya sp. GGD]